MLPSANADAPTSLSSLLLLGLHRIGGSRRPHAGRGSSRAREAPAHHPSRQTYGLEQKGDGPRYPQCARAVSGPQPPPLLTRRCMNAYILTLGRNFLTAWRNAVTRSEHAACKSRGGWNAAEPRPNVPLRESEGD